MCADGYPPRPPSEQAKVRIAHDPGEERPGQDRDLGRVGEPGIGERELGDEQRHREPDARHRRGPDQIAHAHPPRHPGDPRPHHSEAGQRDPEWFSDDESKHDAPRDPAGRGVPQSFAGELHARVRQGEQRDHDEARPRVKQVLHPRQRGHRLPRQPGQPQPLGRVGIRRVGSSTVRSATRCASSLTARGRWNGTAGVSSPSATPGDRRMDSRLERGDPNTDAERHVHAVARMWIRWNAAMSAQSAAATVSASQEMSDGVEERETRMAPMSSTMASVSRKSLSPGGDPQPAGRGRPRANGDVGGHGDAPAPRPVTPALTAR